MSTETVTEAVAAKPPMAFDRMVEIVLKLREVAKKEGTAEALEKAGEVDNADTIFIQMVAAITHHFELALGVDLPGFEFVGEIVDELPPVGESVIEMTFGDDAEKWDFWIKMVAGVLQYIVDENQYGIPMASMHIVLDELLSLEYFDKVRSEFMDDFSEIARYCYVNAAISRDGFESLEEGAVGEVIWTELDLV